MKLLHVYKDFDPPVSGGIERHVALMCRFQRQWAEVAALVCGRRLWTGHEERDGISVLEVGEWARLQGAPVAPTFPVWLRRCEADVVVIHMPNPTAEISALLLHSRAVVVARYHSDIVRQARAMKVYRPLQQAFLRRAGLILPTSQPYLDTSIDLQPHRDRCRVVPLGIVPEDFERVDPARVADLHARYGPNFILFTGRHRYYKGLHVLVEAATAIRAPVVIAGDGPERPALEKLARSLGASVHFPGHLVQEDLVAHLHACAVFAFPSVERSEAFGIVIMEAHACGKPVVATRIGTGVEFINEDGKTGLNVPPRDPRALAEALNRLLDDAPLRAAMGEYAAARIRADFHAEAVARAEFEYYREAAAR